MSFWIQWHQSQWQCVYFTNERKFRPFWQTSVGTVKSYTCKMSIPYIHLSCFYCKLFSICCSKISRHHWIAYQKHTQQFQHSIRLLFVHVNQHEIYLICSSCHHLSVPCSSRWAHLPSAKISFYRIWSEQEIYLPCTNSYLINRLTFHNMYVVHNSRMLA